MCNVSLALTVCASLNTLSMRPHSTMKYSSSRSSAGNLDFSAAAKHLLVSCVNCKRSELNASSKSYSSSGGGGSSLNTGGKTWKIRAKKWEF